MNRRSAICCRDPCFSQFNPYSASYMEVDIKAGRVYCIWSSSAVNEISPRVDSIPLSSVDNRRVTVGFPLASEKISPP